MSGRIELIEYICSLPPEAHIVVDVGASRFVSLCSYIKESDAFGVLRTQGHQLLIHTVVTGGQSMAETMANLTALRQVNREVLRELQRMQKDPAYTPAWRPQSQAETTLQAQAALAQIQSPGR